jgi:hypothetical protein
MGMAALSWIWFEGAGRAYSTMVNIRVHKGMDKFSLRGKIKVNI